MNKDYEQQDEYVEGEPLRQTYTVDQDELRQLMKDVAQIEERVKMVEFASDRQSAHGDRAESHRSFATSCQDYHNKT